MDVMLDFGVSGISQFFVVLSSLILVDILLFLQICWSEFSMLTSLCVKAIYLGRNVYFLYGFRKSLARINKYFGIKDTVLCLRVDNALVKII